MSIASHMITDDNTINDVIKQRHDLTSDIDPKRGSKKTKKREILAKKKWVFFSSLVGLGFLQKCSDFGILRFFFKRRVLGSCLLGFTNIGGSKK